MANAAEIMLRRLQHLRMHPPTAAIFKPELEKAAQTVSRRAAIRREPVRAQVVVTQQLATVQFTGPGAARADAEARELLAKSVPAAVSRAREDIMRKLKVS